MFFNIQMPDCLPGLKPEDNTGPAKPSASTRPSSAMPQSLSDDATQVMKVRGIFNFMTSATPLYETLE
jgi:hypothetical protein